MQPFFSFPFGSNNAGRTSRFIFFMFVFGVMLFCAGFLLSIFGFQSCQSDNLVNCSMTFKVLGPALAVIGLASVVLARSRARLEARRRQSEGDQTDPDSFFLCGESRQFVQFLIFGFLFVTCGILISILGVWLPGCGAGPPSQNGTGTETTYRNCGFLSLQIMGPLIVLIGLCFFVVAHIKKRNSSPDHNESIIDEEPQSPTDEPFQITVGDAVIIFPPPPPPYFADPLSPGSGQGTPLPRSDNPPSYNSIFNIRSRNIGQGNIQDQESIYTISLPSEPAEVYTNPYFSSDPPPKYEEKDPAVPDLETTSSPSSSSTTLNDSAESSPNPVLPDP
ncbi:PREDICTED: transmembrane protein 171 [Nanorana parkeri]|uniref:transmembrane protein 171 n=1 Tax=Nanorana parkeri TaxID=125878 RepID=UPI000854E67D|nr:PREDICTED: transmembrane protein 171 [Nanorana parkeri]